MKIITLLDSFISTELKQDLVSHSKSRTIAGITLFLSAVLLLNSLRGFMQGKPFLGFTLVFVGLLFLLALVILKKSTSYVLAGNYILILYWVMLLYVVGSSAGLKSLITSAFVPFIFTAFLLVGLRSGLIWGVITLATITTLKFMEMNGYPFQQVGENQSYYVNAFVNLVNAILLGTIFAFTSANNQDKAGLLQKEAEESAAEQKKLIEEASQVMASVAKGDLTQKINVELVGELGMLKTSVNRAIEMLRQTMSKVVSSSMQMLTGASELTAAAQSLASGTTEQAATVEEISSSMAEIGSVAKTNNENATQAQVLSKQSTDEIVRGNSQMSAMLNSMTEINETSTNVSRVIKVIDEIAFQTNLLALNAAVEAARAGKYGKGFAVVAEEVRNLAARSAEAAKNTTGLIETSIKEVENGVHNADQTAAILKAFVGSIEKVNDLVGEISSASQEQENSVNEINTSMNQVNQIIQQNSSISEETASSSQELASQAKNLQDLMNNFVLESHAPANVHAVTRSAQPRVEKVSRPVKLIEETKEPGTQRKIVLDDNDFGRF